MKQPSSTGCAYIGHQPPPPHRSSSTDADAPPSPRQPRHPQQPLTTTPTPLLNKHHRGGLPSRLATAALALWASAATTGGGLSSTLLPLHPPAAVASTVIVATMTPPPPTLLQQSIGAAAASVAANSEAKPAVLLLPIAKVEAAIDEIGVLIKDVEGPGWQKALDTLSQPPFDKLTFKKTFNAYADTIYRPTSFNGYTDTPPSSQQSIQYLYRNEILTNLEELREELSYLIQERAKGAGGDWADQSGLSDYWGRAKVAMNKYLSLAPPEDVQSVREAVANQRRQQQP